MNITDALKKVIEGHDLAEAEMVSVMEEIMTGLATNAQIGAFLTALRIKGETLDEITGAVKVMRSKATPIDAGSGIIVDTCGTGGDNTSTFNISTAVAFVAAACGLTVAKHGNKSVSSKSGSADVLHSLGVNIEAPKENVERSLKEIGIGFLFAPMLHGAMKYAGPVRRELGIRTIFNILGPMTNPAGAQYQVLGVYDEKLTDIMANVLGRLGSKHVFVVHGTDGLDEFTLSGNTIVSEFKEGSVTTFEATPSDFGLGRATLDEIRGGTPEENAKIITNIFEGFEGPQMDIVLINVAPLLVATDIAKDFKEAVAIAKEAIMSGKAKEKLNALKRISNG